MQPFVTLEYAAELEGLTYKCLASRISRKPKAYETLEQSAPNGGKPRVLVAVPSLSPAAQRAYQKANPDTSIKKLIVEQRTNAEPWYVTGYMTVDTSSPDFLDACDLKSRISDFIKLSRKERSAYAPQLAQELNVTERSLYRYMEAVLEARAWEIKMGMETGYGYPIFEILALCRKPMEKNKFPGITQEQRAAIENIWFAREFAQNKPSNELLHYKLREWARMAGWEGCPSARTVSRYIDYLYKHTNAKQAHFLAENGMREFKNKQMIKCRRDTKSLAVMEYVQGDAHTFDLWVQVTDAPGKVRAIRPKIVAWIDTRSRMILGDVICENPNSQILKESVVKMIYAPIGGVPKHLHIDNGKDFTAETNTGQNRKERKCTFDSEVKGFYQSMGIEEWSRSLPYEPWSKGQIERVFGRIYGQFEKLFASYTGTLTGSKTSGKVKKDIQGMLERGELLTMEEFYEKWTQWKEEVYSKSLHRGLKEAGEEYTTPLEVFQNAERYEKAPQPYDFARYMLMKAGTALVRNIGIQKFNSTFNHPALARYVGETVNVRWDRRDVTRIYVYNQAGEQVCEAVSSDLLRIAPSVSQTALEEHIKNQKRQQRDARDSLKAYTTPYSERVELSKGGPDVVGGIDLTIKAKQPDKVVALPQDKEYREDLKRQEAAKRRIHDKCVAEGARMLSMSAAKDREDENEVQNMREKWKRQGEELLKQASYGK